MVWHDFLFGVITGAFLMTLTVIGLAYVAYKHHNTTKEENTNE